LKELREIKSDAKALREFGFVMAAFFAIIGAIAMFRGKAHYAYLLSTAGVFGILAVFLPRALLPLQKAWMAFAVVVGFFMSRFILALLFYFVMTPISIIMKIAGKDLLDERIDRSKTSYWKIRTKEDKPAASYENQY
jgi:hypothetical protein